jgi:hypothetical protein
MAKKIRLIDKVETDAESAPAAVQDDNTGSAFTKKDVETLMNIAEAIDWKLWELLKTVHKFESAETED